MQKFHEELEIKIVKRSSFAPGKKNLYKPEERANQEQEKEVIKAETREIKKS